ncbi:dTMP kinase [Kytococcus schroeteri]|uniref:Thymidylate kinase n=1 Tax=Kytococcus schroeteri TaxID=138300 RepID=A0A2I1PC29_9MICO|nr:dTMP kinase [Kytococcus schroeteri]PKZ42175.1 dTMP kinase [Kytococcus schroeteri]
MTASPAGVLVVLEGGDGAGKSTQIARLVEHLGAAHPAREVVVTREPGGTPLGARIRELLLHGDHVAPRAEALLFAADRAHHVASLVRPALERGAVVVGDRYVDSSVAYQGAGRALDATEVASISRWATEGLVPHLTVLLDVDPQEGRRRRGGRDDRLEAESAAFHARVREHFLALAAAAPERYLVLDAARPAADLAAEVAGAVDALLGGAGA